MAWLSNLRPLWAKYKYWGLGLFSLYCLWCMRKLWPGGSGGSGDGGSASSPAPRGAPSSVKETSNRTARQRVLAALPSLKARGISDDELATWRADAASLAAWFHPGASDADEDAAFHQLKTEYSRLALFENQPFHRNAAGQMQKQTKEMPDSVRNPVYWPVLSPFYKDITGNDLRNDIRKYLKDNRFSKFLPWII